MPTINYEFAITAEEIGSNGVKAMYREFPELRFREAAWNGENGDASVTLYAANDGTFFATTNADPIWMSNFEEMGAENLDDAIVMVRRNFEGVAV